MRFRIHMSSGAPSSAFFGGLALLTFMLSWSDVLFSRYLLMGERHQRLLTDLVIEHLKANDVVAARGELAAVAVLTTLVAVAAASAYALMFNKANEVA
jgi:ABC-type glycerol-3-phosphate transport system permease component